MDGKKKERPQNKNLIMFDETTASAAGRKGAIAAAASKRRRKSLKELALAMLQSPVLDDKTRSSLEAMGLDDSNGAAMLAAMLKKAVSGSERAAEYVRDTSGQAPAQVQHIITGDNLQPDEVGALSDDDLRRVISDAE